WTDLPFPEQCCCSGKLECSRSPLGIAGAVTCCSGAQCYDFRWGCPGPVPPKTCESRHRRLASFHHFVNAGECARFESARHKSPPPGGFNVRHQDLCQRPHRRCRSCLLPRSRTRQRTPGTVEPAVGTLDRGSPSWSHWESRSVES